MKLIDGLAVLAAIHKIVSDNLHENATRERGELNMVKLELLRGEEILLQKTGEYTNGSDRVRGRMNGKLILTNQRFLFKTSGIVVKMARLDFEIPFCDIEQVVPCGICFGLKIISKNGDYNQFRIVGRGTWIKLLKEHCNI